MFDQRRWYRNVDSYEKLKRSFYSMERSCAHIHFWLPTMHTGDEDLPSIRLKNKYHTHNSVKELFVSFKQQNPILFVIQ